MRKKRKYSKEYYLANRERIAASTNKWQSANKDKLASYAKKRYQSLSHSPVVYLIVKENYVGVTKNLKSRLNFHKNKSKRDISEVIILCECKTRKEALEIEYALHKEGYVGSALRS